MYSHSTRRFFLGGALASSLGLVACGATGQALNSVRTVKFKLSSATVRWIENPAMQIRWTHSIHASRQITPEMQQQVVLYARQTTNLFREHAPKELRTALASKGVTDEPSQIISLSPSSADYGYPGIAYAVQVFVLDTISKEGWSSTINVRSGLQEDGPNKDVPTVEYTKIFANTAISTFQQAQML